MHWLLRVGSGKEFIHSSKYNIWGVKSTVGLFLHDVKENDTLWFVQSNTKGLLIAVATYIKQVPRELGPLFAATYTNEELGWKEEDLCDTEIHYKDLYNITSLKLESGSLIRSTILKYSDKCKVDLPVEYVNIVKYSNITHTMILSPVSPSIPLPTFYNYKKMKVIELKQLCKERKIKGITKKKKADLIRMLEGTVEEEEEYLSPTLSILCD